MGVAAAETAWAGAWATTEVVDAAAVSAAGACSSLFSSHAADVHYIDGDVEKDVGKVLTSPRRWSKAA